MNPSPTPPPAKTPNGGPVPPIRRVRPADPLVRPKKPKPRFAGANSTSQLNGVTGKNVIKQTTSSGDQPKNVVAASTTPSEPYEDIPLVTTKRALLEGFRHHVMRFYVSTAGKIVDPVDESQFTRPVRLHRRDPRFNPLGPWREGTGGEHDTEMNGEIDDKERERLELQRAERRAEREANMAQIAPDGKNVSSKKRELFQKKTEQVYQFTNSEEKKKQQALKYEETLPWHLEDFDNKNTWAGTYEAALSGSHVMLLPESRAEDAKVSKYRMVSLEKWYKFSAKNRFEALTIEQAEEKMSKKFRDPRWFMDTQKANEMKVKEESTSKLFTRKGERGERKQTFKSEDDADDDRPEVAADADDIDYDYDEAFADDEENPLFGGDDEENREAEEKIKREQREANIFQLKEEKDYDREENEEKEKAKSEKKTARRIQRALMKRERNFAYEDDSDGNPYSSTTESEDSEAEKAKEDALKKEHGLKSSQDKIKSAAGDKLPSGSSSRGTNTPSGRPKVNDFARKSILKRPGSPNLSEASGNESSRKKAKKLHPPSQQLDSTAAAGASISRPTSPGSSQPRRSSIVKLNVDSLKLNSIASRPPQPYRQISFTAASGSEAEGSGGEMTDASSRKMKLKVRSKPNSKNGSRATSPAVTTPGETEKQNSVKAPKSNALPLTLQELTAMIPTEGILMHTLIKDPRVKITPNLSTMLKTISKFDKDTKMLIPRNLPSDVLK